MFFIDAQLLIFRALFKTFRLFSPKNIILTLLLLLLLLTRLRAA